MGSTLRIAADTATFTYDALGNVLTANNRYAQVRRTYNPNGSVATDSLRLRKYTDPADTLFNTHKFGLRYHYDLNGRRDSLYHPTNLAPSQGSVQAYTYADHGPLSEVRNVFGNRYRLFYDALGRLDSLAFPGGWETHEYDNDGRRTARTEHAGSTTVHDDDFTYDQAGLMRTASGIGGWGWQADIVYTGNGKLLATDIYKSGGQPHWIEEYQTDGLSNVSMKRVDEGAKEPEFAYEYDDYHGRLERIVALTLPPPYNPPEWRPDTTYNLYDDAGNVRYTGWRHYYDAGGNPQDDRWALRGSANFFGADGKLMVSQVYRDSVVATTKNRIVRRGMWEEYWYDALGRRVLVRRRGGDSSSLCYGSDYCESSIERFVWDGDQVLWEMRAPGGTSDPLDDTPPYGGDYTQFGRVGYTHGPGLDAPLDLFRRDWNGATKVVLPHKNWRGAYDAGTDTTGTVLSTWDIQFPADYRNAFHSDPEEPFRDLRDWFGSLIQDKADESGLIYMRNRYYDPATGKFTQEDPIGLAGGLNLYGFAGGDPINFSDPFGLCKDNDQTCKDLVAKLRAQEGNRFQTAADIYDATPKSVHLVPGDHKELGGSAGVNRDGDPLSWAGGATKVDAVYLNNEFSEGDLLITAAHEAIEHMEQAIPLDVHPTGNRGDFDSYMQLSDTMQQQAPRWATYLFSKKGLPIPGMSFTGNFWTVLSQINERKP